MKKAEKGHEIKVGDVIVSKHVFGVNKFAVHRVTKKYAFVMYNDIAEGKYPRIFDTTFQSLPRQQWNHTECEVWTK